VSHMRFQGEVTEGALVGTSGKILLVMNVSSQLVENRTTGPVLVVFIGSGLTDDRNGRDRQGFQAGKLRDIVLTCRQCPLYESPQDGFR